MVSKIRLSEGNKRKSGSRPDPGRRDYLHSTAQSLYGTGNNATEVKVLLTVRYILKDIKTDKVLSRSQARLDRRLPDHPKLSSDLRQ